MKSEFEKMADLKQKRIANFQDAKERSIAIASSGRDAVLMVTSMMEMYMKGADMLNVPAKDREDTIKGTIKEWRKFFFYEIYGTDPDDEVKQNLKETLPPNTILGF